MDQIRGLKRAPLLVLLGPTASGKTVLAVALAKQINGAIISADSRQVFKGMDIGTGKDLAIYNGIDHYLIDIREAGDQYHVAHFQDDFQEALLSIRAQGKKPILCGGTGLYIQSVLQDYTFTAVPIDLPLRKQLEEKSGEELEKLYLSLPKPFDFKADISTKKRLIRAIEISFWLKAHQLPKLKAQPLEALVFGLDLPLEERRNRITVRLKERLNAGLLQEVKGLLDRGIHPDKLKFYGLEYKYATAYLLGELDESSFFAKLNTEIHRYAKRQMTYFRKMEKDGLTIHWLNALHSQQENVNAMCRVLNDMG